MHALLFFGLDLETVQHLIEVGGYFVLFGLLFACGLGFPLPEDIPLILAGYFVAQAPGAAGKMHLLPAAIVAWTGIMSGDCVLYSLGRRYGLNITRIPLIGRHVTQTRIVWLETKFEKWGIGVVAVGRMFAGIRGAMVVAAGITRFKFYKFVIADGLAAVVSGGLFLYLGILVGKHAGSLEDMRTHIHRTEHRLIAFGLCVAVGVSVWVWYRRKRVVRISDKKIIVKDADIVIEQHPGAAMDPGPPRQVMGSSGGVVD
jgi:membrane protein DedA with SNARE-associated domain